MSLQTAFCVFNELGLDTWESAELAGHLQHLLSFKTDLKEVLL